MRRTGMTLAIVTLAVLLAVPVAGQSEEPLGGEAGGAISVLAVLTASEGTFDRDAEGLGQLSLEGVERATWFSDRPARQVGVYDIDQMHEVFFADGVPPNAALEMLTGPDETQDVVILELSSPVFDADARRLVYDAIVLEPGTSARDGSALGAHHARADAAVPATFGTAALFIDSALGCQVDVPSPFTGDVDLIEGVTCAQAAQIVEIMPPTLCQGHVSRDTPFGRWSCRGPIYTEITKASYDNELLTGGFTVR